MKTIKSFMVTIYSLFAILLAIDAQIVDPFGVRNNQDNPNVAFVARNLAEIFMQTNDKLSQDFWIYSKGQTQATSFQLYDILSEFLQIVENRSWQNGQWDQVGWYYTLNTRIFLVDSLESLQFLVEYLKTPATRQMTHKTFFLIVLLPENGAGLFTEPPLETLKDIFQYLFDLKQLNVNIAVPFADESLRYYTFDPFVPGQCFAIQIEVILEDQSSLTLDDLFISKTDNFNGCLFQVITNDYRPFIVLQMENETVASIEGIEGIILNIVAEKLNFSMSFISNAETHAGNVYENGSADGMFFKLGANEGHIGLGDLSCTPVRRTFFSSTSFYYQSGIYLIFRKTEAYSSLEALFYPFALPLWETIFVLFTLRFFLKKFLRNVTKIMSSHLQRFILFLWILLMFQLRVHYEGSYFSYLHSRPIAPLPKTFKEFHAKDYTLLIDYVTSQYLDDTIYQDLSRKVKFLRYYPTETYLLLEQLRGQRYALLTKLEYLKYFITEKADLRGLFFQIPKAFIVDILCTYFPKFSYLTHAYDEVVEQLFTAGIISKISKSSSLSSIPPTSHISLERSAHHKDKLAISLDHLSGVFLLYGALLAVAFFLFIGELISMRVPQIKKGLRKVSGLTSC